MALATAAIWNLLTIETEIVVVVVRILCYVCCLPCYSFSVVSTQQRLCEIPTQQSLFSSTVSTTPWKFPEI